MSHKLNKLVKRTLAMYTDRKEEDIIIASNKEKYFDKHLPTESTDYSTKIFDLMKNLNIAGPENNRLGVVDNGNSFKDALEHSICDILTYLDNSLLFI